VTVETTAKYLYAAAKSGSSYIVVAKYGSQISPITNGEVTFNVSPQNICEGAAGGSSNCSNFDDNVAASVTEAEKAINVYFFVSSESLVVGAKDIGAPSASYSGGVFFQMNMSNQVYTDSESTVSLSELRQGDRRVIGTFSSSSSIGNLKGLYAYLHDSATDSCTSIREPGRCQGSFNSTAVSLFQNGEFTLSGLTNGSDVRVSVALVDKFGFSTTVSNSIKVTPAEIQELLKKQACFILTAGFGEEHYVTNYFRGYRDQTLAHSWFGKKLIRFYYKAAPQYALMIYKSEVMRFGIRMMAYVIYYLFNYYWVILLGLLFCSFFKMGKFKFSLRKNQL
jgi:hypothetical protein